MTATVEAIQTNPTLAFVMERGDVSSYGQNDLPELWRTHGEKIDKALWSNGAVLFRGFGVTSQEEFEHLMGCFKGRLLEYIDGNSPRTKVGAGVYTSTEYPAEYFISLHNELSYSANWPKRLFFCCVQEPSSGGETPLVDSRRLLRELPEDLVQAFRNLKVRYIRNLHAGKGFGPSWQKTFQTEDKTEAEELARGTGVEVEWLSGGILRLSATRAATTTHPMTGEEVWFNQADQFHPSTHPKAIYQTMVALYKGREDLMPQNATFGDGSSIPLEHLNTIRNTTRRLLTAFSWRLGDVVMVDNVLAAHGRMPFTGSRRILVSMTAH